MRYATDQVFKPLDPMRPVDTAQAFAVERKRKPLKILGITFGAIIAPVSYTHLTLPTNSRV